MMDTLTGKLGIAVILAGVGLMIVGGFGYDTLSADRTIGVDTVNDEDAYLGVDLSAPTELLQSEADSTPFCFFACGRYQYNDVELAVLTDQSPSGALSVENLTIVSDNENLVRGDGLRGEQLDSEVQTILGDFSCPVEWTLIGTPDQAAASALITINGTVTDGTITIEFERQLWVDCIAG